MGRRRRSDDDDADDDDGLEPFPVLWLMGRSQPTVAIGFDQVFSANATVI